MQGAVESAGDALLDISSPPWTRLTEKEKRIAILYASGHDSSTISHLEDCSVSWVNDHLRDAVRALGLKSRAQMAFLIGRDLDAFLSSEAAGR